MNYNRSEVASTCLFIYLFIDRPIDRLIVLLIGLCAVHSWAT